MEKFNNIYLFTTENIAGYLEDLDLTNKKVITVTGSSDHILNIILKGSLDITTFDINPLSKYFMDLKLALVKELSYKEFQDFLMYDTKLTFNKEIIEKLDMNNDSKLFFLNELKKYNDDGIKLKQSNLFNLKYFNIENKINCNLYLNKKNYSIIKKRINRVKIKYLNVNLKDLVLKEKFDYMFLSNISDYLKLIYQDNYLEKYQELIYKFLNNVKIIYFAYVYNIDSNNKRTDIDDIEKVEKLFSNFKIKKFKTALINEIETTQDGVYIKMEEY